MSGDDILWAMLFGGISFATALVALGLSARYLPGLLRVGQGAQAREAPVGANAHAMGLTDLRRRYEFRDGYLLSSIDHNDAFLDPATDRSFAFDVLRRNLVRLHPDLDARIIALKARGEPFLLTGRFGSDPLQIAGRVDGDRMIVTVSPSAGDEGRETVDSGALAALRTERAALGRALDMAPAAMWRHEADGRITWANEPYFALLDRARPGDAARSWPLPALFDIDPKAQSGKDAPKRCRLTLNGETDAASFEVSAEATEDGTVLCAALAVDRLEKAETALRSFVQTLSQTFAHLPIGLVVFNRARELVLFNPALVTLTTLEPQFLSNRPGLTAFLDALRDRQRMPEPKNYKAWRAEIARLEQGAQDGNYHEIWTLPDGGSYRVIGRPHPDGALAFMIEDISSEVSLTRRFRGDLALFQGVLDDVDSAVAGFASDGRLVLRNAAFASLWPTAPELENEPATLSEAVRLWRGGAEPTDLWQEIEAFADRRRSRHAWSGEVTMLDGARLTAHVSALPGGATKVLFEPAHRDILPPPTEKRTPRAIPMEAAEAQAEFVAWNDPAAQKS